MKFNNRQRNSGFTIIEAMVAIFILTVSVASMLGITASSAASARYANNEITANYLLQEAVDSIRNSRDTMVFQKKYTWDDFLKRYGKQGNTKCFSVNGCILIVEDFDPSNVGNGKDIDTCEDTGCQNFRYDSTILNKTFYNYTDGDESEFKRTVKMEVDVAKPDELKVIVTMNWFNGSNTNERFQNLTFYLLNWQKN